jgi:hypothetical protein
MAHPLGNERKMMTTGTQGTTQQREVRLGKKRRPGGLEALVCQQEGIGHGVSAPLLMMLVHCSALHSTHEPVERAAPVGTTSYASAVSTSYTIVAMARSSSTTRMRPQYLGIDAGARRGGSS